MYRLIEAQRDYLLDITQQWKVKTTSSVYMYACLHDLLIFNLPMQNRNEMHHERIATLEHQIEVLQIDEDDDDEGESEGGTRDGGDPEGQESDA